MKMLRIKEVVPLNGLTVRLILTNGAVVVRDLASVLFGPVFVPVRDDRSLFEQMFVTETGTIGWPNDTDLDPDVLIWGGPAPRGKTARPPDFLHLEPADSSPAATAG